jgi:hypothetical protein
MDHPPVVTRAYICPSCYDLVEIERPWGHACTPRCKKCKLLMLSLRTFAAWSKKPGHRRRVGAPLAAG